MNGKEETSDLASLIISILTTTDYDTRGEAGDAREIAENCAKIMGRLIETLARHGALDDDELNDIVSSYRISNIRHA